MLMGFYTLTDLTAGPRDSILHCCQCVSLYNSPQCSQCFTDEWQGSLPDSEQITMSPPQHYCYIERLCALVNLVVADCTILMKHMSAGDTKVRAQAFSCFSHQIRYFSTGWPYSAGNSLWTIGAVLFIHVRSSDILLMVISPVINHPSNIKIG